METANNENEKLGMSQYTERLSELDINMESVIQMAELLNVSAYTALESAVTTFRNMTPQKDALANRENLIVILRELPKSGLLSYTVNQAYPMIMERMRILKEISGLAGDSFSEEIYAMDTEYVSGRHKELKNYLESINER